MVGHLTATVNLHYRYVAGREQVAAVGVNAQREHRRMFREPDLVCLLVVARIGERLHRPPDGLVGLATEMPERKRVRHNAILTSSWSVRSW